MAISNKWYDDEQYSGATNALSTVDNRIRTLSQDIRERHLSGGLYWPYDTTDADKAKAGLSYCSPDAYNATKWQVFANSSNVPKLSQALLEVDGTTATSAVLSFRGNGTVSSLTCNSAGIAVPHVTISGTSSSINGSLIVTKASYRYVCLCLVGHGDAGSPGIEDCQTRIPPGCGGTIVEISASSKTTTSSLTLDFYKKAGSYSGGASTVAVGSGDTSVGQVVLGSGKTSAYTTVSVATTADDLIWVDVSNTDSRFYLVQITIRQNL